MRSENVSRRRLLCQAGTLTTLGAMFLLVACKKDTTAQACSDQAATSAEKALRDAQHYVDLSPDQSKTCSGCSFFAAADHSNTCGHCQIFNGAASPSGHCDAWAAKA